jgi:hypothetical protein
VLYRKKGYMYNSLQVIYNAKIKGGWLIRFNIGLYKNNVVSANKLHRSNRAAARAAAVAWLMAHMCSLSTRVFLTVASHGFQNFRGFVLRESNSTDRNHWHNVQQHRTRGMATLGKIVWVIFVKLPLGVLKFSFKFNNSCLHLSFTRKFVTI